MKNDKLSSVCAAMLILLWSYAALSKLLDYREFHWQLQNQEIPRSAVPVLVWLLPASELAIAGILLSRHGRATGFWASVVLLSIFTGYITLVLLGLTARLPCSCGGVIGRLGWGQHLIFNLFFLGLALTGLTAKFRQTGQAENL